MNKKDVDSIEKLEEYYNKCRKFKFEDDIKINTLDDIWDNLFGGFVNYENKPNVIQKCTEYMRGAIHCHVGKYRSIGDFLIITKYYFPNKSIKELFEYLILKFNKVSNVGSTIVLLYCSNVRKYNIRGISNWKNYYSLDILNYDLNDLFPNLNLKIKTLCE